MRDRYASLREGLVGAWCPSIEGSGYTLPDLSGNGNNGTLTNMGPEDWVSGQYGRALDFDGSNDYVAVNDNSTLSPLVELSIAFWAKPTTLPPASNGNRMWAVTKGNTNNFEYECSINSFSTSFGKWHCVYYDLIGNAARARASAVDAVALAWQHVCWTAKRDGSFPDIYVNGELSNGSTITAGTPVAGDGTSQLQIGRRANASDVTFNGQLDDIRIYNRVLSEPEIKLLASRPGIGLRPQRRTMYYAPPTGARRRRVLTSMP